MGGYDALIPPEQPPGKGNSAKGKGKGKGKGPRKRTPLTTEPVFGSVASMNNVSGWIVPLEPINHPTRDYRECKVHFKRRDWTGATPPEQEQMVSFIPYLGDDGFLGAQTCGPADV